MKLLVSIVLLLTLPLGCGGGGGTSAPPAPDPDPLIGVGVEYAPPAYVSVNSELGFLYAIMPEEEDAYAWSIEDGPTGMTVETGAGATPAAAIVRWKPDSGDRGAHAVQVVGRSNSRICRIDWTLTVLGQTLLAEGLIPAATGGSLAVDETAHPGKGFSITLPPNVLENDTVFRIWENDLPADSSLSTVFSVTPRMTFGWTAAPSDQSAPTHVNQVGVSVPYDPGLPEALRQQAESPDSNLTAVGLDEQTGKWELLDNVAVDASEARVTGNTKHFSTFTVTLLERGAILLAQKILNTEGYVTTIKTTGPMDTFVAGEKNLLLLHGFGSWFPKNGDDSARFQALFAWAKHSGYQNVLAFTYPFEYGVHSSAHYLREQFGKSPPFDIVAHSMGGVVARYAIEALQMENVEKLVTLGSPHNGLPLLGTPLPIYEAADLVGLADHSPEVLYLATLNALRGWRALRQTRYCFIAGAALLVNDGLIPVASATAAGTVAEDGAARFTFTGTENTVGSVSFRGTYYHSDLHEQISTNGVGAAAEHFLAGQAPRTILDVNGDGSVNLDDYELVLMTVIHGIDPEHPRVNDMIRMRVQLRWDLSYDLAEAYMLACDVNLDGVWDERDRECFEQWAPDGFATLFRTDDAYILKTPSLADTNMSPRQTLNLHRGHDASYSTGRSLARFDVQDLKKRVTRNLAWWPTADLVQEARPMLLSDSSVIGRSDDVEVRTVTSSWAGSTVTWNSRPSTGNLVATAHYINTGDLKGFTSFAEASGFQLASTVRNWVENSGGTNHGLELRLADEATSLKGMDLNLPSNTSPAYARVVGGKAINYGIVLLVRYERP